MEINSTQVSVEVYHDGGMHQEDAREICDMVTFQGAYCLVRMIKYTLFHVRGLKISLET